MQGWRDRFLHFIGGSTFICRPIVGPEHRPLDQKHGDIMNQIFRDSVFSILHGLQHTRYMLAFREKVGVRGYVGIRIAARVRAWGNQSSRGVGRGQ